MRNAQPVASSSRSSQADEAIRLADLTPAQRHAQRHAQRRTVVLLGHEQSGVPAEGLQRADLAVEIPMVGTGASLNVAVAGSLVLYRLAGLI